MTGLQRDVDQGSLAQLNTHLQSQSDSGGVVGGGFLLLICDECALCATRLTWVILIKVTLT